MSSIRLLILLGIFLVAGCSNDRGSDPAANLPRASLPGVYKGDFPCEGCPGIESTLWLRSDGRFFFKQHYAAGDTREAMDAFSLGRWNLIVGDGAIELSGSGPMRVFMRMDRDTLVMQTDSDLEHQLTRDPTATGINATISLAGTMRKVGDNVLFSECLTGLVAPVNRSGDFARFWHQYRAAGRSTESTYVELEGSYSWSGDGSAQSLTIERFITVKSAGACLRSNVHR